MTSIRAPCAHAGLRDENMTGCGNAGSRPIQGSTGMPVLGRLRHRWSFSNHAMGPPDSGGCGRQPVTVTRRPSTCRERHGSAAHLHQSVYLRAVPYQRDAGMTETEALQLASVITDAAVGPVAVEREGHFFVVTVTAAEGTFTIRDHADWRWLRPNASD